MKPKSLIHCVCAATLLAAVLAGPAAAQDSNVYERVLVPISVGNVPGAFGSLWSTELWYRNNSDKPVAIFPLAVADPVPTIKRTEPLPVGNFPASAPGTLLYVSRDGGDQVQFDLRLFNRADPKSAWGTKLPVVREREFAGSASLINVPTGADFRSALRVYGLPDSTLIGETVDVKLYSNDEKLLASAELTFDGWPRYAAILSLADAFPEARPAERVRVVVEARNAQIKIWAFVSVTSNATQTVTVVTPE
jgi:hypothetical protein